jgi:hypothetical protein
MPLAVLPVYVTVVTDASVASALVLIRSAWSLSSTLLFSTWMPVTAAPVETEPIEIPWPPEQVLRWKIMLEPLFIAIQSSWFRIVLSSIVRSLVETSKPSLEVVQYCI